MRGAELDDPSFAISRQIFPPLEFQILDPQTQSLQWAHADAIQQAEDQSIGPFSPSISAHTSRGVSTTGSRLVT